MPDAEHQLYELGLDCGHSKMDALNGPTLIVAKLIVVTTRSYLSIKRDGVGCCVTSSTTKFEDPE